MKLAALLATAIGVIALQSCAHQPSAYSSAKQNSVADDNSSRAQLYFNADIVTMDQSKPTVQAVLVHDGKIAATGSLAELRNQSARQVQMIDLQGKTLMPGFIDAHGHVSYTALNLAAANVSSPPVGQAETVEDVVQLLIAHRDRTPTDGWIVGWGYDDSLLSERRHPTRQDLDRVSIDRPVVIRHVSGHFVSCNSACLAAAGINAESPNPAGGIIRRQARSNEPDGVLEETAMHALFAVFPQPDKDLRLKLLVSAQQYYASHGITTVQDGAAQIDEIELLREAAALGMLKLDIVSFPYAPYLAERLSEFPAASDYEGHFRVGGIKLVLDGSPQGKTAWLTKPYLHPPHGQKADYVGYPTLKDAEVAEYVGYAFKNGIPLLAHANGDAAADQLIAAVTDANREFGVADRRTVMIHAQTVREDQVDSMLEQGILPSYFSAHTFYWGDWHRDSVFGGERASRISPLRSTADKGLRYTTHNDTPIVPPDMMRLVWASVNRITRSGKVLGEAQRATVLEALKSITIDAAHQYFEENQKGSITTGKQADFVVLDNNPLKVNPLAIKDIKVLQTVKAGELVFSRQPKGELTP